MTSEQLLQAAREVRAHAYVPYSKFAVGAAILAADGRVYTGCNVENASYGLSNCAERSAVFHMVSAGDVQIQAIAVVADTDRPISPCGACRQVLAEFATADTPVYLASVHGVELSTTMGDLLPYAFAKEDLQDD